MREFASLLEAPSPAVLTTYRKDGTAVASPVWFRFRDDTFEVVIAEDDLKLRHLAVRPECELVVFETVPPFRGIRSGAERRLRRCRSMGKCCPPPLSPLLRGTVLWPVLNDGLG